MSGRSIFICVFIFGFQIGVLYSSEFQRTVSNWQNSFKSSDFCKKILQSCQNQINTAVKKGQAQSNVEKDIKAAVEMINIYTSDYPETFKSANAVLRGHPSSGVSEKDKKMFREFAKILEKSIDILCNKFPDKCEKHGTVYRGQSYCVSITSPTYTFDSFLSTSKKIEKAEIFYGYCPSSSVLFVMSEVQGIYVREYSVLPDEEEVLVKQTAKFQITLNLNSTSDPKHQPDIAIRISHLGRQTIPKSFIAGTMIGFTSASTGLFDPKLVGTVLTMIAVCMFTGI